MSAEAARDQPTIVTEPVGHHGGGLPEPPGVDARRLLWLAGAALLLMFGAVGGLGTLYEYKVPQQTVPAPRNFPQPRVAAGEPEELQRILSRQRDELKAFHWADKEHTRIQIPIERAMKLIAQKGDHGYDPVANPPGALTSPRAGAERSVTPSANEPTQPPTPPARGAENSP